MLRRQPRPEVPPSVESLRSGFAALMATMSVPDGIKTTEATLGPRRALLVEPVAGTRAGTILYFHGGGFVSGSPETAMSLTGNLVARTGLRGRFASAATVPSNGHRDVSRPSRTVVVTGRPAELLSPFGAAVRAAP